MAPLHYVDSTVPPGMTLDDWRRARERPKPQKKPRRLRALLTRTRRPR